MPRRDPPTDEDVRRVKALFGAAFRALRKREGLTRIDLATDAGLNDESLARIERGEGNPEFKTLISIALAMDVSLAQLFGSMGQSEGSGRQLTVQERDVAVNGLLVALDAFTGGASGELTARGVTRPSPQDTSVRYPTPRTGGKDRTRRKRRPSPEPPAPPESLGSGKSKKPQKPRGKR